MATQAKPQQLYNFGQTGRKCELPWIGSLHFSRLRWNQRWCAQLAGPSARQVRRHTPESNASKCISMQLLQLHHRLQTYQRNLLLTRAQAEASHRSLVPDAFGHANIYCAPPAGYHTTCIQQGTKQIDHMKSSQCVSESDASLKPSLQEGSRCLCSEIFKGAGANT